MRLVRRHHFYLPQTLLGLSLLAGACQQNISQTGQDLIEDQVHNNGTQGFFFLPPALLGYSLHRLFLRRSCVASLPATRRDNQLQLNDVEIRRAATSGNLHRMTRRTF